MPEDKNNFQKWVFSKTKIMTHNDIFPPNNAFEAGYNIALEVNESNNINDKQVRGESMKTKQQLLDEIKALQVEHDAMPDMGINYKPKMGENYFTIHSDGDIDRSTWSADEFDKAHYAIGNCYPTRKAAERIVRNRMTLVKLREFAFVPDFSDDNQDKYTVCLELGVLKHETTIYVNTGVPVHFATTKLIDVAEDAVGEAALADMLEGGLV